MPVGMPGQSGQWVRTRTQRDAKIFKKEKQEESRRLASYARLPTRVFLVGVGFLLALSAVLNAL